jgi:hypothetical protein
MLCCRRSNRSWLGTGRLVSTQKRPELLPRPLRFESLEDRRVLSVAMPPMEHLYQAPALFVENQGQWADAAVCYFHQGQGASVAMMDSRVAFQVMRREPLDPASAEDATSSASRLRNERLGVPLASTEMRQFAAEFVDAADVRPHGLQPSQTRFNYFIGDEASWRSAVPGFEKVAYEGLYPGIDLYTWGLRSSLKYEFHVAPGADWSQIQVRYDGIAELSLTDTGALTVNLGDGWGQWVDDRPFIYQVLDGQQVEVAGQFALVDESSYTFVVTGPYDATAPLIIDPDLAWSSYLGGSGADRAYDVATDASGNILVTGETASSRWVSGGWDTSLSYIDAFVVKLSPTGDHLWSTYVGGTADEFGYGIAADSNGNVIVTGETMWDGSENSPDSDTFVIKLSPELQRLYSKDIDYGRVDFGVGIAIDSADNVLISGMTADSETTITGYVTKLSPTLGNVWFRNLGIYAAGVVLDAADNVFVSGEGSSGGFVTKLTSANGSLWTISLGGSGGYATGIAVDGDGNALVTGYTESSGWTSDGYDTAYGGNGDGFVAKLNTANGARLWSSYLGGSEVDIGWGVAVDTGGDVLVAGLTNSGSWVSGGIDLTYDGNTDAFLVRLTSLGEHVWSGYLGGTQEDIGWSVDVDEAGSVVVVGETQSSGWLTGTAKGGDDAFVVKFAPPNQPPVIDSLSAEPNPVTRPADLTLTATGVNDVDGQVVRVEFYRDTNGSGEWEDGDELLDADEDGTDGWTWTMSTADWALGAHTFLARAEDDQGEWSEAAVGVVDVLNAEPVIASLEAEPASPTRPADLTLTATGVVDADGNVVRVEFYRDSNGSGTWDAEDEPLGVDEDGADGWSWTGSTAGWTLGQQWLFTSVQDDDAVWSVPVGVLVDIANAPPVVTSLATAPNPVVRSADLTLTAEEVSDADGQVVEVAFYRDADGSGDWDADDVLLGTDEDGGDGWGWTDSTMGWALGSHTVFARAQDNDGAWSDPVAASLVVENAWPDVSSFAGNRNPLPQSADLTLTAVVSDLDGEVVSVEFYRDTNGSGEWDDGDESLAGAPAGDDQWTWTANTAGWDLGSHVFFARAQDNDGQWTAAVACSVTVAYWQNLDNPFDINADGDVDSGDVLVLVNEINRDGGGLLPPRSTANQNRPFYDVNADGFLTPLDVLLVICEINRTTLAPSSPLASVTAEGEAANGQKDGLLPSATGQLGDQPGTKWYCPSESTQGLPGVTALKRSSVLPRDAWPDALGPRMVEAWLAPPFVRAAALDSFFAELG